MSDIWAGRVDEGAQRWHQIVRFGDAEEGSIALLGLCSDEGVRRNQGRVGAADGPNSIRRAMANLPEVRKLDLVDLGDVICDGEALESAVDEYVKIGSEALRQGGRLLGLGGGHEIAWATYSALRIAAGDKPIGIVNIDAHFDLRLSKVMSSGTPFRQALNDLSGTVKYAVWGISAASNTEDLFDAARQNRVWSVQDSRLNAWELNGVTDRFRAWCADTYCLYLSIDLDALPASVCPGVSAPAARGIGIDVVEELIMIVANSGKLVAADIAELNPRFDIDERTAKVAARLSHTLVSKWCSLHRQRFIKSSED